MAATIYIEGFTPSEASELTGVGTVLQRDHRRRFPEWLPQRAGHARFNLFQCLQMRFVGAAAELGIGPSAAYEAGEWVAHNALQYALVEAGCIDGHLGDRCTIPDASEAEVLKYTARQVFADGFGRPRITENEFAFICGDGSDWFGPSLDAFLSSLNDDDPRRGKPIMALHLPSFAGQVVAKLPRPAVRIIQEENT